MLDLQLFIFLVFWSLHQFFIWWYQKKVVTLQAEIKIVELKKLKAYENEIILDRSDRIALL